jgi:hypothetical protein
MSETFTSVLGSLTAFMVGFAVIFAILWLSFKYLARRAKRRVTTDVQAMWDELDRIIGSLERLKKEEE